MDNEERLAVFIDYENLALGAREHLGGMQFDFGPIADALAVRGRVVVRRAYADWSYFDEDRRALTRHQVELIEMPQRMGASRKNAADIKMVVDTIEMAFERDYISTFVMCTGDSDFSPLVHKLRELNKRVIGVGVELSTSRLLPAACDEFLFYDRLEGVDVPDEEPRPKATRSRGARRRSVAGAPEAVPPGDGGKQEPVEPDKAGAVSSGRKRKVKETPPPEPAEVAVVDEDAEEPAGEPPTMEVRVAQTLKDLQASSSDSVTASMLKRTLVRKDPTFSESDYGFRTFGEFIRFLADRGFVVLSEGPSKGDPEISLPEAGDADAAFALLRSVVQGSGGSAALSGLKNAVRKERPDFSEKALGYRGFLQFAKAAQDSGAVSLAWDDAADDYLVTAL
ncbi:NYN domain-containing protein [Myceligenerans pegani]|uniref:NYN domain-containing protein n=1 Tax=Myceligenerans pegani TaxID=2776917 RepID=A0ABR9N2M2_9MICO|nr:NYN domain-containing protein [Myceligenerans sp. TRM 65318]MBE1877895.1 NYN domain-containing protein [Myceligenerans sp. TRM 65318]MBE3020166.1 NYN domain-containing protein [Myceligenerans sp. TRM 65318]